MSYDLYYVGSDGEQFDAQAARRYLELVTHCTVSDTAGGGFQGWYQNPDTGVYWSCAYAPPSTDEESLFAADENLAGAVETGLAFNLNFGRPQYFGLEAMPYAARIGRDLALRVYDPQDDCKVAEPNEEKLVGSWIQNNERASSRLEASKHMDRRDALAMWRYNSNHTAAQTHLDSIAVDALVPVIFPFTKRGTDKVFRVVLWAWNLAAAFPPCDAVIVATWEKQSLIRRLTGKRVEVERMARWSDLAPARLALVSQNISGLDYLVCQAMSGDELERTIASVPLEPLEEFEVVQAGMFLDTPTTRRPS
jgi:hypothetical protein